MRIAKETWEIDPVASREDWFVQWGSIEPEVWECVRRYLNARSFLMHQEFD